MNADRQGPAYDHPARVAQRSELARRATQARSASGRKHNCDPATNDLDYTPDEVEFMFAVDTYRRESGHKFPSSSELLGVLVKLGYRKPAN